MGQQRQRLRPLHLPTERRTTSRLLSLRRNYKRTSSPPEPHARRLRSTNSTLPSRRVRLHRLSPPRLHYRRSVTQSSLSNRRGIFLCAHQRRPPNEPKRNTNL